MPGLLDKKARRNATEIRKDIEVLTDFERGYREFVQAMEQERRGTGASPWSQDVVAERRRDIMMRAPRADVAAKASGAGYLEVREPPALGGAVRSASLPAQVLDFERVGFGVEEDGLDIPRQILDYIPAQLGALKLQLEEAESGETNIPVLHPARRLPTLFGRIRHLPRAIAVLGDIGGAVAFVGLVGRLIGFW